MEGDFGVLARGARADLLLLDANPLKNIANTRAISGLMIRGRWWTKDSIDAELEALQLEYAEDRSAIRRMKQQKAAMGRSSEHH